MACVSRADNWKRIYGRTRGQPGFTYLWNLDIGIYFIVSWVVVKTHHMHCSIHRHDKINQTFNNVTGKPTFFFGVRTTKYSVRTTIFWNVVVLRTTTFWSDFYGPGTDSNPQLQSNDIKQIDRMSWVSALGFMLWTHPNPHLDNCKPLLNHTSPLMVR